MHMPLYHTVFTLTTGVLSWILNTFLFFIIYKHSSKQFGNYKYLMLLMALFDLSYSTIHMVALPAVHIYDRAFIVFATTFQGYSTENVRYLTALFCSLFAQSMFVFCMHFLYRYFHVTKPYMMHWFTKPRYISVFVALYLFAGIDYGLTCYYNFGPTAFKNDYFREEFLRDYDGVSEEIAYIGPVYYRTSEAGVQLQWIDIIGVINVSIVVFGTLGVMLYCGFKTYSSMKVSKTVFNKSTMQMQEQLFRVLLIQTIFPMVCTFVPCCIVIGFSMVSISIGSLGNVCSVLFTFFPVLDPIVILYFIKSYRVACISYSRKLLSFLTCGRKVFSSMPVTDIRMQRTTGVSHIFPTYNRPGLVFHSNSKRSSGF